jgi:hypothetical protein
VHWVHTPGCREQPLATLSVNELHALALEDPIARRRAGVVIFLIAVANLNLGQVRKSLCSRSEIWGGGRLAWIRDANGSRVAAVEERGIDDGSCDVVRRVLSGSE